MSAAPGTGSVGEEAARLLEALQGAARNWQQGGRTGHENTEHDNTEHDNTEHESAPAACRVCPVCQLIDAFQHVRPGTVRHLADAAASLTAVLADLVPSRDEGPPGDAGQDGAATTHDPGPSPRRPDDVQHIDITD